jgi:hypothetical protein
LATVWADDGNLYTVMDDGGTDVTAPGALWRQSFARITGFPPRIHIAHVGDPNAPAPHTWKQIHRNPALYGGPLGPYYSIGLLAADHMLFATQQFDWDWQHNSQFTGLYGIGFSRDAGAHWRLVHKRFPAPLGNLEWVIRGRGGVYPDGYVYAIASEREFNASELFMGRTRPHRADITNPARWQWVSGFSQWHGQSWPRFARSFGLAVPVLGWPSHITYPQMSYDPPLHRYLLTFTFSYAGSPPGIWRAGADLVILEAPHPWGPFSFVAHEPEFGPSNGYAPGFPVKWISANGRDLWLKWSANFDGCASGLDCSGGYGFNYRRMHLDAG